MEAQTEFGMTPVKKPLPQGDLYDIPGLASVFRDGIKKLFNAMLFAEESLTRKPKGTADLLPKHYNARQLCGLIAEAQPNFQSAH